jgi:PAS domain S-box-containing protein
LHDGTSTPTVASSEASRIRAATADGWRLLFWTVFSRSKNPLLVLDNERRIVAVNDAQLDTFAYSREELVGRRVDMLLAPEEWRSIDDEWRTFLRRGDFEAERACVRADGRRLDVQYAMRWARLDGRMLALVVILDAKLEPQRTRLAEATAISALTPREIEVVGHVAMGQRAREIASDLGVAESTVRTHIRQAMKKSGARTQAQLVALVCTGQMPQPTVTQ